ncbi:MAG TPA: glycosyltransferase [Ktedonobacterales bacterium]|nr:glycosyltransferase [Ktedonobacterales bacterium]
MLNSEEQGQSRPERASASAAAESDTALSTRRRQPNPARRIPAKSGGAESRRSKSTTQDPQPTIDAAPTVAPKTPATTTTPAAPRRRAAATQGAANATTAPAAVRETPTAKAPTAARAPKAAPVRRAGGISPENTIFVSLSFEGPDVYSTAGGLGTRVTEFTEALASLGYETHLIFVGDPTAPSVEQKVDGKLYLERWSQWISKYYLNGVYDGEEQKLYDYNESVPYHVYQEIAAPAIAQGKMVVVIGEDWHTAETICRISDLLHWHGVRDRCVLMWNCNSLMSLHRINWGRLNYCATITTVSRYMKHRLWQYGVNPLAIPNGIPSRYLEPVDQRQADELRQVMQRGNPDRLFLFKIGRFDPDKRWLMAVEALARLKYSGHPAAMVIRGGIEPHGAEVLGRAHYLGLNIRDVEARRPSPEECMRLLRDAGEADIYNLKFFVPADFVRTCYAAADATLANSGHEPFGLVGLEVMAAEGIAFTGSTGEDYAVSFENAVALETDDPEEIVGYLLHMVQHPEERDKVRAAGKRTAGEFTWEEVIDNLVGKLGYLARRQNIVLA